MCIHETIQLSQDGERIIVCGDCGREFAKIMEDEAETLAVPVPRGGATVVLLDGGFDAERGMAMANAGGVFSPQTVYPCARCGWSASCEKYEGEDCHT